MLDLIRLRTVSVPLKIELFFNAGLAEHVKTALNSLLKTEILQQSAEVIKSDWRVGRTAQNALKKAADRGATLVGLSGLLDAVVISTFFSDSARRDG